MIRAQYNLGGDSREDYLMGGIFAETEDRAMQKMLDQRQAFVGLALEPCYLI
jgi:hypothetical protein